MNMFNLILSLVLFQQVYAPADFTQVSGASVKAKYDAAVEQGRRGSDDTFWVAWRFAVRPGIRINTLGNNVMISSTTTSDGGPWS